MLSMKVDTPRPTEKQLAQRKADLARCIAYSTAHQHVTHSEEQKLMDFRKAHPYYWLIK